MVRLVSQFFSSHPMQRCDMRCKEEHALMRWLCFIRSFEMSRLQLTCTELSIVFFNLLQVLCFLHYYHLRGDAVFAAAALHVVSSLHVQNIDSFYPNVTTLHSGLCYRKSVCRLSVFCNVRAPYSGSWNFRQYVSAVFYLSHLLTSVQNSTNVVSGKRFRRGR